MGTSSRAVAAREDALCRRTRGVDVRFDDFAAAEAPFAPALVDGFAVEAPFALALVDGFAAVEAPSALVLVDGFAVEAPFALAFVDGFPDAPSAPALVDGFPAETPFVLGLRRDAGLALERDLVGVFAAAPDPPFPSLAEASRPRDAARRAVAR